MPEAVLGLGGNLGARRAIFEAAIALLGGQPGCVVLARSALYETPPLGPPQPDYLNAAVRVHWDGSAEQLLAVAHHIESLLGRVRRVRWGARTLDIDLLHWSDGRVQSEQLEVPHRELGTRTFALAPLLDVAPELAPTWQPVLSALGGPPARVEPGWPAPMREGAYVCGDWQCDESELGSQLAELLGQALTASSHATPQPGESQRESDLPASWGCHEFTGPGELFDENGQSWLTAVVVSAWLRGFMVHRAAVLERDEARTTGVLVGLGALPRVTSTASNFRSHAQGHAATAAVDGVLLRAPVGISLELETGSEGKRRVKMRWDTPERGFDFSGSGTM